MYVNSIDGICQDDEGNLLYEQRQLGSQGEGYWSSEDAVNQASEVVSKMAARFPYCRIVVIVDNSPAHHRYASDALRVSHLNRTSGGKQPILRPSTFDIFREVKNYKAGMDWSTAEFVEHKLDRAFTQNMNTVIKGKRERLIPKGVQTILAERIKAAGCENNLSSMNLLDLRSYLACQPDFLQVKSEFEEAILDAGGICLFLPRFHPELNVIGHLILLPFLILDRVTFCMFRVLLGNFKTVCSRFKYRKTNRLEEEP